MSQQKFKTKPVVKVKLQAQIYNMIACKNKEEYEGAIQYTNTKCQ